MVCTGKCKTLLFYSKSRYHHALAFGDFLIKRLFDEISKPNAYDIPETKRGSLSKCSISIHGL